MATATRQGDYGRAVTILESMTDGDHKDEISFYRLLADGTQADGWNPYTVHATIANDLPEFVGDGGVEIALQLERAGRVAESFAFLLGRNAEVTSPELLLLIRLTSTALQAAALSSDDPMVEQVMDRSIAFLATHPGDGRVRTRLARPLAP